MVRSKFALIYKKTVIKVQSTSIKEVSTHFKICDSKLLKIGDTYLLEEDAISKELCLYVLLSTNSDLAWKKLSKRSTVIGWTRKQINSLI